MRADRSPAHRFHLALLLHSLSAVTAVPKFVRMPGRNREEVVQWNHIA